MTNDNAIDSLPHQLPYWIMSHHSVAEAGNQLSELIDRALAGEGVVITRHGHPVVELRPVAVQADSVSSDELDWLAQRRVGRQPPQNDAGTLVSAMRDAETL